MVLSANRQVYLKPSENLSVKGTRRGQAEFRRNTLDRSAEFCKLRCRFFAGCPPAQSR